MYLMSSNESHSLKFSHKVSYENDFPQQFLLVVPSCSHTTSVKPHGWLYPLMFSLRYTDILTAVQKHSVAPMFVCLAYGLWLQSCACTEAGSEGTKPWPGCVLLKAQVVINVLFFDIPLHLHLTSDALRIIDWIWLPLFCVTDNVW